MSHYEGITHAWMEPIKFIPKTNVTKIVVYVEKMCKKCGIVRKSSLLLPTLFLMVIHIRECGSTM